VRAGVSRSLAYLSHELFVSRHARVPKHPQAVVFGASQPIVGGHRRGELYRAKIRDSQNRPSGCKQNAEYQSDDLAPVRWEILDPAKTS
jgi:hypothetical protein